MIEIYKPRPFVQQITSYTKDVRADGLGIVTVPSRLSFDLIRPDTPPTGIVFVDGSFLVARIILVFEQRPSEREPHVHYAEYTFHYQRPQDNFFFRYDHHPAIGEPETHPPFHLHAGAWKEGMTKLPDVPRFPVEAVTLNTVLDLIRVNYFFTPQSTPVPARRSGK